jgi:hypothetical protein
VLAQNDPASHAEHDDCPVAGLNVPTAQAVQKAEVELVWNMPAPQLTHAPAAAPAYWPAGQLVQFVAPVA